VARQAKWHDDFTPKSFVAGFDIRHIPIGQDIAKTGQEFVG
jgi:hypothetical protein